VTIRSTSATLVIIVCGVSPLWGQSAQPAQANTTATPATWAFSAAVYTYVLPEESNYAQPTVAARHGGLHLEARYNYEDRETGSIWIGCVFGGGDSLEWEITPLAGGVFGQTTGVAPGYKGSLNWRRLEAYSEGEYLFDTGESTDSFFYNWSELTFAPVEWLRGGIVTQRTRTYQTEREIQRGLLIGTTYQKLDVTTYIFNPDDSKPTVVVAASVNW